MKDHVGQYIVFDGGLIKDREVLGVAVGGQTVVDSNFELSLYVEQVGEWPWQIPPERATWRNAFTRLYVMGMKLDGKEYDCADNKLSFGSCTSTSADTGAPVAGPADNQGKLMFYFSDGQFRFWPNIHYKDAFGFKFKEFHIDGTGKLHIDNDDGTKYWSGNPYSTYTPAGTVAADATSTTL